MEINLSTDVLVIGGGGAAARAALEARNLGAEVILAVKGNFGAVGTRGGGATASGISPFGVFATPGWKGSLSKGEQPLINMIGAAPDKAFTNILQVGLGMADPKLAKIIVEEAVDTREKLMSLGTLFGEYGMRSHGVTIMAAFCTHIRGCGIEILERTMIVSLLVQDGECLGAVGFNEVTGDTVVIKAGSIVIATGGDAQLFMVNLNPSCNCGDGYTMGYKAGAELMNLEFKQIFLGTVYPNKNMLIKPIPPYVKITNTDGEEFLKNYLPEGASESECLAQRNSRNPFSTRDSLSRYVDIAIQNEVKCGRGTKHNAVYIDRSDPRNPLLETQRNEYFLYRGIDFSAGPVEVGVCHHCSLGGFRINENAETTVANLYAAGEVAAGPHGADRIGGCMLLASQVFGARAGKNSAKHAMGKKRTEVDNAVIKNALDEITSLYQKGTVKPASAKKALQETAYYNLLVVRNEKNLKKFLRDVAYIEETMVPNLDAQNTPDMLDALELKNLIELAKIEALVCLERKESRGPHYREDYPTQNDNDWVKNVIIKQVNGAPVIDTVAINNDWENVGDDKIGGYWA